MPEIQTSTGTDIFYQTLFLKKVIEDNRLGIRLAEPVFATRDVLVSEYIAGPVFRDALQSIMNGNSKDEAMRLIGNFAEGVTAPLYNLFFDASHDYFKKYRGERKDAPLSRLLTLPDFVIRGGDRFWKMLLEGDEIPHVPGLTNWIVTGVDPQELQSLPNLSDEEQIEWLKEHLVLIDPFAGIAYLTPEEAARYDGLIISSEKEETFPAAVKPRLKGTQQVIEPPIYSRSETQSETQEASPAYTQVANDAMKPRGRGRVLEYMSSLRKKILG